MAAEALTKAEFWEQAATFGFAAWAIVLPGVAWWFVRALNNFSDRFEVYVLAMEHRMTFLETEHKAVMIRLERMEDDHR